MLSKKQLVAIYDYLKLARFDAEQRAGDANNLKMPLFRAEIVAEAKRRARELKRLEAALEEEIGEIDDTDKGDDTEEWQAHAANRKGAETSGQVKAGTGAKPKRAATTAGGRSKGKRKKTSGGKRKCDDSAQS